MSVWSILLGLLIELVDLLARAVAAEEAGKLPEGVVNSASMGVALETHGGLDMAVDAGGGLGAGFVGEVVSG
ncbi:hypothetical protein QBC41DRAFT_304042 [Cercophora samala]|uniref:Uncharacterized protein n=1 Tax=Cercophora samala TaxID=330535 RepID=A0AA40D993_9PEZI|nr:hypothetical protein QBC41DRAFT_304042 [Cercophora samala]